MCIIVKVVIRDIGGGSMEILTREASASYGGTCNPFVGEGQYGIKNSCWMCIIVKMW